MNSVAMYIRVQVYVRVPVFSSFEQIAKSGIPGSYCNSVFNILFSTVAVPSAMYEHSGTF